MDIEINYVKKIYETIASHFDNTRHYKWTWISDFMLKTHINSSILDMGCGNGRNMDYSRNIIGIDNCSEFVKICQKKGFNALESNIINTPFLSNSFDHIINIAVFHHLSNDERRIKCLNEMYRILKPNGSILISIWSKNQPEKTKKKFKNYGDNYVSWNNNSKIYERYYYIFQIEEIKNLFKIANFKIKDYKWDCGNEIFILTK